MRYSKRIPTHGERLAGVLVALGVLAILLSAFSMGLRSLDPEPRVVTDGGRGAVMLVGVIVSLAGLALSRRR